MRTLNGLAEGARSLTLRPISCRRPFGVTSIAMNRMMNGTLRSMPRSTSSPANSLEISFWTTPTIRPPTKAIGMDWKRPIAAAPKACTTSSESTLTSSWKVTEAKSTPEIAANIEPMIHAVRRTFAGAVPAMSSSCGLSTTPRIATPSRERRKNRASPTAAATPMPMSMTLSQLTETLETLKACSCGRNGSKVSCSEPQIRITIERTATSRPTVATIL